ncbi:MAG: pilus assembly protein N-terminal domain-containing protein, partial [Pirellulaceae bacterium]
MKKPISEGKAVGVVAVGDPNVADFEILPNPRMLRLSGRRAGVTDLTIILADESVVTFQVLVKYDLELLQMELNQRFPDSQIRVSQIRDSLVLEGQV